MRRRPVWYRLLAMSDDVRCDRAIAFLKGEAPPHDDRHVIELGHDDSPVFREIGGGLLVSYVVDRGDHFEFINHGHLAAQDVTEDQLFELGLANLRKEVDALEVRVHSAPSYFAVIAGGNYEASLLLLDEFWDDAFRPFVTGTYAAAVPARDILAFGDASSADSLAELRTVIQRVWPGGDHLLTDRLLTRQDGTWKVLTS